MVSKIKPLARVSELVIQENNNEILVYDLTINKALCLNESTALIWKLCDGRSSLPEIREKVNNILTTNIGDDFIWLAIDELGKNNLLSRENGHPKAFNGLTRREVIRRLGFTTVVAIPIISSVIAPNSIHAQSCVAPTSPVGDPNGVPNNGPTSCDQFDSLCCNGDAGVTFAIGGTAFCGCSPAP
ncbi:MAG: PqqD family protein [Acidobacteria bacterium]|nr:PqqD family protein [Acidobacteriota bacterium]